MLVSIAESPTMYLMPRTHLGAIAKLQAKPRYLAFAHFNTNDIHVCMSDCCEAQYKSASRKVSLVVQASCADHVHHLEKVHST